ncbi:glycosyltransferase family 1 protein [Geomicrobium sediminis]|uniref:Glycosyltransferase involved in cell wall biosynthesis n=1 Tax=Geomicrobium sediminis TaxID=1347788 RepID=A0ABS2P816_9BACL|nr:glycosyltransferase family 1 protein [Geomicrobium sediminis]MBM7631563.1 glycosyltransferase involved in cell wall biosynthesis [Geomicrobium sediminis]
MKVLHLPYGAGIASLSEALREIGVHAESCSFYSTNTYNDLADYKLDLDRLSKVKKEEKLKQFFEHAKKTYDVFHFHFGETFHPMFLDVKELNEKGKKVVVHHRGSEVRRLSIARRNNPDVVVKKDWSEQRIKKRLQTLSKYVKVAIVNDLELVQYVTDNYERVEVVPHALNHHKISPAFPNENDVPMIVHAPSHQEIKGTTEIEAAIRRLRDEGYELNYQRLEHKTREEVVRELAEATIVIDQLKIGTYANLTMEAMASGKPVICFIHEQYRKSYPNQLPIVQATIDTIYDVLLDLLRRQSEWAQIGQQSRNYVEQFHSYPVVANKLKKIYETL